MVVYLQGSFVLDSKTVKTMSFQCGVKDTVLQWVNKSVPLAFQDLSFICFTSACLSFLICKIGIAVVAKHKLRFVCL